MFSPAKLATFGSSTLLAASLFLMPSSAQIQNPIKAAKDAYNKARQDAQAKQQKPPQQAPQAGTTNSPAGAAEPWKPPVENSNAAAVALDPAKMPDIVGVHLGMAPQEAMQIMRKQYPANYRVLVMPANSPLDGQVIKGADDNFQISDPASGDSPLGYISFTAPPEKQVVWHVARYTRGMHVNRETLLATLREKYGKETAALMSISMRSGKTTDSSQIADMFWLFDERGDRVPYPPDTAFQNRTIWDCRMAGATIEALIRPDSRGPTDDAALTKMFSGSGWCASMVAVHVAINDPRPIVDSVFTEIVDVPLAIRTAHASTVWWRDIAEKARKEDLEKSKKARPVF
jgi:hypothetical protein